MTAGDLFKTYVEQVANGERFLPSSPVFDSLNLKCEMMCSGVFASYEDEHGEGVRPHELMCAVPYQRSLFGSLSEIMSHVSGDVNALELLQGFDDKDTDEIIFFVDQRNPSRWYGFVVVEYSRGCGDDDELSGELLSTALCVHVIYVKPEFRGQKRGSVMMYDLGRIYFEWVELFLKVNPDVRELKMCVEGKGVNEQGSRCLVSLFESVGFYGALFEECGVEYEIDCRETN
ncbi:hypothetical protein ACP3V3_01890 [Vibrio sp. PNB22_3_1]